MPDRLCDELVFEILTRAPLETVGRFRAVSRQWNRITYEPSFVELHPRQTRTIAGYFVQGLTSNNHWSRFVSAAGEAPDMSLSFLPRDVSIEACDRGILLCRKDRRETRPYVPQYYVCKPSTKEWVRIPNPKTKYFTLITAILVVQSRPHCVKILRISEHPSPSLNGLRCEIFNSEAWTWKRLADMKIPYKYNFGRTDPVVVGGKAFWLSLNKYMFVFDMYNESWSVFLLSINPDKEMAHHWSARLLNHEGKLGLLLPTKERSNVYLFVMEGEDPTSGQPVWRERNSYCLEELAGWPHNQLLSLHSANDALMQEWDRNVSICRCQPPFTAGVFEMKCQRIDQVFPFYSDLEPSNLQGLPEHSSKITQTKKKARIGMLCPMITIFAVLIVGLAVAYTIFSS